MGTATRRRGILTLYAMLGHIVAELQGERYLELGVSYPVYFYCLSYSQKQPYGVCIVIV